MTGGTNWWGDPDGAPNADPTVTSRTMPSDFYPVGAPSVLHRHLAGDGRAGRRLDGHHPGQRLRLHRGGVEHRRAQPLHPDRGPADRVPSRCHRDWPRVPTTSTSTSPTPRRCPATVPTTPTRRHRARTWAPSSRRPRSTSTGVMVVKTSTTNYADGGYGKAGDQHRLQLRRDQHGPGHADQHHRQRQHDAERGHHLPGIVHWAPGTPENCTGTYTVTQTDVDNGSVTNTAT